METDPVETDSVDLASLVPLAGGWSGETFVAEVAGERVVARLYTEASSRGVAGAGIDAALLCLVRGLLPVPDVLELRPADPATGSPGLLLTSFLAGVRGDELLPSLDDTGLAAAGRAIGGLLADLAGMPMLSAGPFVDDRLTIGTFGQPGGDFDGLAAYVEAREPELAHLSVDELAGLREVATQAQTLLDTVTRCCLVHSDVNPKNLLVDPETLAVTGLLDWEFAHAGHPFTDLGNVLRFNRQPAYAEAVLGTYGDRRSVPLDGALDGALGLARAADLWALVDLACRRRANPVAARADRLLRAIARRRDPGASEPG